MRTRLVLLGLLLAGGSSFAEDEKKAPGPSEPLSYRIANSTSEQVSVRMSHIKRGDIKARVKLATVRGGKVESGVETVHYGDPTLGFGPNTRDIAIVVRDHREVAIGTAYFDIQTSGIPGAEAINPRDQFLHITVQRTARPVRYFATITVVSKNPNPDDSE